MGVPSSPLPAVIEEHANWIGGEWRPALKEHVFEIAAGNDLARAIGRWPRSSERDVELAVVAGSRAEAGWRALAFAKRRAILERAARALASAPDPGGLIAARVGLEGREIAPHFDGIEDTLQRALSEGPYASPGRAAVRSGLLLFQADWSELYREPLRALVAALVHGRSIVMLSDPRTPMLAENIARALQEAGLPSGVLGLLHDDGETCLRAGIEESAISGLCVSGPAVHLRRVERIVHSLHPAAHDTPPGAAVHFGAGLEDPPGPALDLRVLRNASRVIGASADAALEACEVVVQAFSRSQALSGQAPGAVGRVLCHERIFSRFTSELLLELERHADVSQPLPLTDREVAAHVRRAYELGLDEGATPIFSGKSRRPGASRARAETGEPAPERAAERAADRSHDRGPDRAPERAPERKPAPAPSKKTRAPVSLWPIVFTNVEEHMRLAWLGRPAPVVCLMRIASDAAGAALAAQLDRDPLAEDLSTPESEAPEDDE